MIVTKRHSSIIALGIAVCTGLIAAACSDEDTGKAGGGEAGEAGAAGSNVGGSAGETAAGAGGEAGGGLPGSAGPTDKFATTNMFDHPRGTAKSGQDVFRFETFGNEGFWTRVLQLPQGIAAANLTPVMALKAGLSVDIDAIPAGDVKTKLAAEVKTDLSPANAPLLNDPATTIALIEMNAVLGISARNIQKPLNGKIDINNDDVFAGESVGITCAFCHSITDGSVLVVPNGGTIGKRVDGPTNHFLNVGASIALGAQSRAYYPTLALNLVANMGKSVSRKGVSMNLISAAATEVEVDAYLNNPDLYPVGSFDDAIDGNGAPMHITPMFRADLQAPEGSDGSIKLLPSFNNLVYTALLDPTDITTAGGRKFLMDRGGAAGVEIADNFEKILAELTVPKGGTNGYPFVGRAGNTEVTTGLDAGAKNEDSFIGMRVNETKLKNLSSYFDSLPAPAGDKTDPDAIARGRVVFRQQCTSCHNEDQSKFVPQNIVPFNSTVDLFSKAPARPTLWPGYDGGDALAERPLTPSTVAPSITSLVPVRNSVGIFDDKLIIVEASNLGLPRGDALPMLMDLKRKPVFLHDNSVASLDALLDPKQRAADAPHPFFVGNAAERADVITFLNSLDDQPLD